MTYWQLKKMRRQQANQIKDGFFIPMAPINTNPGLDNSEVVDESEVIDESKVVDESEIVNGSVIAVNGEDSVEEVEKAEVPTDDSVETEVVAEAEQDSPEITESEDDVKKSNPPKATRRKAKSTKSE